MWGEATSVLINTQILPATAAMGMKPQLMGSARPLVSSEHYISHSCLPTASPSWCFMAKHWHSTLLRAVCTHCD